MLHPVGSLQPNVFGLFDVYGNVKEWSHSLEQERPDDVRVVDADQRSVLGGCFLHFQQNVVSTYYVKHGNPPALQEYLNGFRIARTLSPQAD